MTVGRSRAGRSGAVLGMLLVAVGPIAAGAATITVNATADAVDALPGDGVCAAASGACTVRAALQEANALMGTDRIVVPAGVFALTIPGAGENAGATGDLDVLDDVEIEGTGSDVSVLDGGGLDRVIHVPGHYTLVLSRFTVRNGRTTDPGGGVSSSAVELTLRDMRFENNSGSNGGAVAHGNQALVVSGCAFEDNVAAGGDGGGLWKSGSGTADIENAQFTRNRVTGTGAGGGAVIQNDAAVTIRDTVFSANIADDVGGLAVLSSSGAVTLSNSRILDSIATGEIGGFYFQGAGPVSIAGTTISGNLAVTQVGGVRLGTTAGAIEITGSTISDNRSGTVGGAMVQVGGGPFTLQDSTVADNTAFDGPVGGAYILGSVPMTFDGVEIRGNSASVAGGLYLAGQTSAVLTGCRIAENRSATHAGGMYDAGAGPTTIQRSTVSGNIAAGGGCGGLCRVASAGGLTIEGSTFSYNVAAGAGAGGGAVADSSPAASTVTNSTFSGNWAVTAGAFDASAPVTFASCTFAGNGATGGTAADVRNGAAVTVTGTILADTAAGASCGGAAVTSGGSNLNEDASCGLSGAGDHSGVDPQLGPLGDHGGSTQTHALAAASVAIDAGGGVCPAADQRGVARPADGNGDGSATCDIGAYEFVDECPDDPAKTAPGACGCGVADADANGNGAVDCLLGAELKARIAGAKTMVAALASDGTPAQRALRRALRAEAKGIQTFVRRHRVAIPLADPRAKLPRLARRAAAASRGAAAQRGGGLARAQSRATAALDALDAAVAAS